MQQSWRGQWALVTGASSGLGEEFAQQLAAAGCRLILVARRVELLEALAVDLKSRYGVEIRVAAMDLLMPGAAAELQRHTRAAGIDVAILINNAGFGLFGDFLAMPWSRLEQMLRLDMDVLTELTHGYGQSMAERGSGWILNVASIGAFQATPSYAAYSAAKSYVLMLSEALNFELRGRGVRVTALSPGITATEFLQVSGQRATLYQRLVMMQSPAVVRAGLRGLARGVPGVVPGWANWLTVWSLRILPRRLQAWLAASFMRN